MGWALIQKETETCIRVKKSARQTTFLPEATFPFTINTPLNINKFAFKYLVTTIRIKVPIYNSQTGQKNNIVTYAHACIYPHPQTQIYTRSLRFQTQ